MTQETKDLRAMYAAIKIKERRETRQRHATAWVCGGMLAVLAYLLWRVA